MNENNNLGGRGIAVLGLGNPILCDDAVGLRVCEELMSLLKTDPLEGVEVLTSTRAGFELIDLLTGFEHAILVDCFAAEHPRPGHIRRLTLADFSGSARLNAVHEISLATAFELAKQMNIPMPAGLDIYAVEAGDISTFTEELTPDVAAVVTPLAMEIHARIKDHPARKSGIKSDEDSIQGGTSRSFYPHDNG